MTPEDLRRFGFPTVLAFQRATMYPGKDRKMLALDGKWGPQTAHAASHLPNLSAHFTVSECRSHGNRSCLVRRELVFALEVLHARVGDRLSLVSVYRDPSYNASLVGHAPPEDGLQHGASRNSQHVYGLAADPSEHSHVTVDDVATCKMFSGIGVDRSTGHVRHVDVRHVDPSTNTTRSTVGHPARWWYE